MNGNEGSGFTWRDERVERILGRLRVAVRTRRSVAGIENLGGQSRQRGIGL